MATFADTRRSCLLRSFLDVGKFAEEIQYLPRDGEPRTLRALVQPARANLRERQIGVATVEEIDVRVSTDQAAAVDGATIGGVARPQIGDGLVRAGDTADEAFSFAFVVEKTAFSWLCRFERETPEQWGGNTRG